jgi:ribosomal subunit interface protein
MKLPLQITFRDLESSPWITDHVRRHAEKLDTFCDRIMSCRVALEAPDPHTHKNATQIRVRVDVKVPHKELVSVHMPAQDDASANDLYLAIDAAFAKMIRELEDYNRIRHLSVKRHDGAPRGRVTKLFADRGYGFLENDEGTEIYFHENSVLKHKFHSLSVGSEVRFAEELGEKGPQASTVEMIGAPRRAVEQGDRPSYV